MGDSGDDLIRSYLSLRRAVGVLGVTLPVILVIGNWVLTSSLERQYSISHYFHTGMRDVFVGILFAIGVFLFFYKGYPRDSAENDYKPSDNFAGNLACFFAFGVALFPTSLDPGSGDWVSRVHSLSAAGMFLTLAYFSFFLFTKTDDPYPKKPKLARNRSYRILGVVMLICVAGIAVYGTLPGDNSMARFQPVFWLESLALWAFGWSWFIKGETLWKDKG